MTAQQATQRRPSRTIDNPRRHCETERESALLRRDSQARQQARPHDGGDRPCHAASVGSGHGAADALQRLALGGNGEQTPDQRQREPVSMLAPNSQAPATPPMPVPTEERNAMASARPSSGKVSLTVR